MDGSSPCRRRHRLAWTPSTHRLASLEVRESSALPNRDADRVPWRSIVSSQLGRSPLVRQPRLSALHGFVSQSLTLHQAVIAIPKTAAYPWVQRSAQLLGAPTITPIFSGCRDTAAIELADVVDAIYVRPGGKIETLLRNRLQQRDSASYPSVRVLLTGDQDDEPARDLMALGAIGVYRPAIAPVQPVVNVTEIFESEHWLTQESMREPDRWLIHSTRARQAAWPGESEMQFIDSLLLSPPTLYQPSPQETLQRIIDQRRLIGTHRTSSASVPVVCFTSQLLESWLSRRAFRPHLGRWDAEPYGIAIDRRYADSLGLMPVIYGDQQTLESLPLEDRWRYQAAGETYDWTQEQEWRGRGVIDLNRLPIDAVRIFVATQQDAMRLTNVPWSVVVVN